MSQRKCRLFLVDAFTQERFCGNPAAVVLDADVLEEQEMRRLARELFRLQRASLAGWDLVVMAKPAAVAAEVPS